MAGRLNFTDLYNLSNTIFIDPNWKEGILYNAPFQWGNWLANNPNGVYYIGSLIKNDEINTLSLSGTPYIESGIWITIQLSVSRTQSEFLPGSYNPQYNSSAFAIQVNKNSDPLKVDCDYAFAITISAHNLGATQSVPSICR
jgi:hypothetical protein